MNDMAKHDAGPMRLAEAGVGMRARYMLFLLTACYTLAFLDSRLPLILVESIKADLRLSDTQMGVIVGPAFSVTYAISTIPIARLSDRLRRKHVIAAAIAFWSICTAAGGAAYNFLSLLFARTGLAVGESALTPAAHSMISDSFPARARGRAIAIYSTGITLGIFSSLALGGYINDQYGWRAAMYLVGALGIIMVLLILFTLREPERATREADTGQTRTRATVRSLLSDPVIRHTIIGGTVLGISLGAISWIPAYMLRNFDMTTSQVGASYGAAGGVAGLLGIIAGGVVTDALAKRDARWPFRFLAAAFVLGALAEICALFLSTVMGFLILICIASALLLTYPGPTFGMIQSRAGSESRSFASAVGVFCLQGIGISTGGLLTGVLSDHLPYDGPAGPLRGALTIIALFLIWAAFHYYWATRYLARENVQS